MRKKKFSAILGITALSVAAFAARSVATTDQPGTDDTVKPKSPISGSGPNIALPTLGGKQLWADTFIYAGWRIQQNVVTGHFRLLDNKDIRRAWGDEAACREEFEKLRKELTLKHNSKHAVILLHGIGRSKETFNKMALFLAEEGYEVIAVNYPSTRRPLSEHADQLAEILEGLEGIETVSFVTHSMGGIVLRAYFGQHMWPQNLGKGRTMMFGPPNSGSTLASLIKSLPFDIVYGESGEELAVTDLSHFPAPEMPFAVIAGGLGDGQGYNPLIDGDDDGVVTVVEAQLDGAAAFMVIDQLHTFLPSDERAIAATISFMKEGSLGI